MKFRHGLKCVLDREKIPNTPAIPLPQNFMRELHCNRLIYKQSELYDILKSSLISNGRSLRFGIMAAFILSFSMWLIIANLLRILTSHGPFFHNV
jgi:hypothetical protein